MPQESPDDISEGGVIGALYEVAEGHEIKLDVTSQEIVYAKGAEDLNGETLRAPTYGSLIIIVDPEGVIEVNQKCQEIGVFCSVIGSVSMGAGLIVDGEMITEQKRMGIDEIYGSFDKTE